MYFAVGGAAVQLDENGSIEFMGVMSGTVETDDDDLSSDEEIETAATALGLTMLLTQYSIEDGYVGHTVSVTNLASTIQHMIDSLG